MEDKRGGAEKKKSSPRGVVKGKDLARAHEKVPRGHYKGEKKISIPKKGIQL